MYQPNDELNRRMPRGTQEYPHGTGSARGSLIGLLIVVVLLGGLVVLGSLGGGTADDGDAGSTGTGGVTITPAPDTASQ